MTLRYLTGEPLNVYSKIAEQYGFYNRKKQKFEYNLECETRKKANFHYNDLNINHILEGAKEYYNNNSSSSVIITNLVPYNDHFEITVSSEYPLEGPSRTLALFGQHLSKNPVFTPLISGSSILKYNDKSYDNRALALSEFETHQKTMSDYDFIKFFTSRMTAGGVSSTNEERKYIDKAKKELYEFMASPIEYLSRITP